MINLKILCLISNFHSQKLFCIRDRYSTTLNSNIFKYMNQLTYLYQSFSFKSDFFKAILKIKYTVENSPSIYPKSIYLSFNFLSFPPPLFYNIPHISISHFPLTPRKFNPSTLCLFTSNILLKLKLPTCRKHLIPLFYCPLIFISFKTSYSFPSS